MKFLSGFIIRPGCVAFVFEVAEVIGFVVEPYGRGPLLLSFVPMDASVFRGGPGRPASISAVLGEGAQTQVRLAVVQAVVVDVVHDEMVRGVHDLTVHFDALAARFSHGVAILRRSFGEPCIATQTRIVLGIDDSAFAPCERDPPRREIMGISGPRWVEIGALIQRRADRPVAFGAFFLAADQDGTAGTGGEGRKTAIVASKFGFFVAHKTCYERENKCTI